MGTPAPLLGTLPSHCLYPYTPSNTRFFLSQKTEIVYSLLGLLLKLMLGYLLYQNLLKEDSFNAALMLDKNSSIVEVGTTVITTTVITTVTGGGTSATTATTGVDATLYSQSPPPPAA